MLDNEMPSHATYLGDPLLTSLPFIPQANPDERIPALLLEPFRLMMVKDTSTGTVHEMRTERLVADGFQRIRPGTPPRIRNASGWALCRVGETIILREPAGDAAIKSPMRFDPQWVSAAVGSGRVLVLHGSPLGVRIPPGVNPSDFTIEARIEEIRRASEYGLLSGGFVDWVGRTTEAFSWVLFPPGAFGIPAPIAYVPLWNFSPSGGPASLGLVQLKDAPFAPMAKIKATLTDTDIDLFDPAIESREDAFLGGFHASPRILGFFARWRQLAIACEGFVLISGAREMPSILGADAANTRLAFEIMRESWSGKVALE